MKQILRLFMCAVMLQWLVCSCSKPVEPVNVLLDQAAEKAGTGDWGEAGKLADKVLKQDANNVNALLIRAMAYENSDSLNAHKSALDHAIRAAEIAPDIFLAQYLKGLLLYRDGKYNLAFDPLYKAFQLRPNDTATLQLLAETSLASRKYDNAIIYFKIIARKTNMRQTTYPYTGLGVCLADRNPALALRFFQVARKFAPGDSSLILNSAIVYDRGLHDKTKAIQNYEKFIEMSSSSPEYDLFRKKVQVRLAYLKEH